MKAKLFHYRLVRSGKYQAARLLFHWMIFGTVKIFDTDKESRESGLVDFLEKYGRSINRYNSVSYYRWGR